MTNLDKCGNVIKIQNLGQMRKLGQLPVSILSSLILLQMENGKDIFDKCSIINNLHILGTRNRLLFISFRNVQMSNVGMRAAESPKCAALLKAFYCLKFTIEFPLNGDQLS